MLFGNTTFLICYCYHSAHNSELPYSLFFMQQPSPQAQLLLYSITFYVFTPPVTPLPLCFFSFRLKFTYNLRNRASPSHGLNVDTFSTSYLESLSIPFRNHRSSFFVPGNLIFSTGIIFFSIVTSGHSPIVNAKKRLNNIPFRVYCLAPCVD